MSHFSKPPARPVAQSALPSPTAPAARPVAASLKVPRAAKALAVGLVVLALGAWSMLRSGGRPPDPITACQDAVGQLRIDKGAVLGASEGRIAGLSFALQPLTAGAVTGRVTIDYDTTGSYGDVHHRSRILDVQCDFSPTNTLETARVFPPKGR